MVDLTKKHYTLEELHQITENVDRFALLLQDKTLFITGGTGFMGKVLVEKLLRRTECKIYLLMRNKKGKDPNERLKEIFDHMFFDLLRKEKGADAFKRVTAISGDVSEVDLGISPEDRQTLIDEVHIMYHVAATTRFDEPLKKSVLINTRGTKYMIELAHQVKNLMVICHVSTAYCHLEERILYERAYDPPCDPHSIIRIVESYDDETLEAITPKLLGGVPNTYTYSKSLAEGLVNDELNRLPIIMCRPSLIGPIWKEPLPGWVDNLNGIMGLIVGAGKGVIRTGYCDPKGYADGLPADIAINGLLSAISYYIGRRDRQIFNMTVGNLYKVLFEDAIEIGRDVYKRYPLNWVLWYPGGSMKTNRFYAEVTILLYHFLPALFVDTVLVCLGLEPVLLRIQRRILRGFKMFDFFAYKKIDFDNIESLKARAEMNEIESKLYCLDGEGMNYYEFTETTILMGRRHIFHQTDDSLPVARLWMRVMYFVDKFCKTVIISGFLYFMYWAFWDRVTDAAVAFFDLIIMVVSTFFFG